MPSALKWLWEKVSGNAMWDGVKWLWAAGGAALTTVTQAVWAWYTGHPNEAPLFIGLAALALFLAGAITVTKLGRSHAKDSGIADRNCIKSSSGSRSNTRNSQPDSRLEARYAATIADLQSKSQGLQQQLERPDIAPEILSATVKGEGSSGVILGLKVRITNRGRVKAAVNSTWMYVDDRHHLQWPAKLLEQYEGTSLDASGALEYAVPRTGWIYFEVEHKRKYDIGGGHIVFYVEDGTGKKVSTTAPVP